MKTVIEPTPDGKIASRSAKCVVFAITSHDGISRAALHKAARLARTMGAQLELFYCAFDVDLLHSGRLSARSPEEDVREHLEQRQKQLWSVAKDLRAAGLSVQTRVEWESRAEEGIVREVLRREPSFLLLESANASPKLIETCPCPLLLIRNARSYPPHPRIAAAVDPMHAHAKTAALDAAIVAAAGELSSALSGELHLFHARVPWAVASHQARGPSWVPDVAKGEDQIAYEHAVESRLEELAGRHEISALRMHLVDGAVTECLPSFARAEGFDVIALGALSRSMLERILIGSTARRMLEELDCDVLIVKQPGFQTPVELPDS